MPELPELRVAARIVNRMCSNLVFSGARPLVNEGLDPRDVSRRPLIEEAWYDYDVNFTIEAQHRGKEVRLTLTPFFASSSSSPPPPLISRPLLITFRFGLVGKFKLLTRAAYQQQLKATKGGVRLALPVVGKRKVEAGDIIDEDSKADKRQQQLHLVFVDKLGYGSFHVGCDFDTVNRSPDPTLEYAAFRRNVLTNLDKAAFNRPICEAMLNQGYFNGIGNYLRAEILHRAGIPPFRVARDVLSTLQGATATRSIASFFAAAKPTPPQKASAATIDILQLCRDMPLEVIAIREQQVPPTATGGEDEDDKNNDNGPYEYGETKDLAMDAWRKCYGKAPHQEVDANKRVIWYYGESGRPTPPKVCGEQLQHSRRRPLHNLDNVKNVDVDIDIESFAPLLKKQKVTVHLKYPPASAEDHAALQAELVGRDVRLRRLFAEVGSLDFSKLRAPPLVAVVSAIVGQQITYAKAREIRRRLYGKLTKSYGAEQVLTITPVEWEQWGLSAHRVPVIARVAKLPAATWEEPIDWAQVKATAGIGQWSLITAQLQCTDNPDLFPAGDKFLEKKLRKLIGTTKAPADVWSGYRSYITWYLWRWFAV